MLKVKRFINELMSSNCYIIYDETYDDCIIIDPASEKCLQEISFFCEKCIYPSYVILTHEHTDHTWGTNTLIDLYNSQVICSKTCSENLLMESNSYFRLYFDDSNYSYKVKRIDIFSDDINSFVWHEYIIEFLSTPGHSIGSICIFIDKYLFTGDTWMQYKPYINKRNGSKVLYEDSLQKLKKRFINETVNIMPGHGEPFISTN